MPEPPDSAGAFALKGKVGIREGGEQFSASFLWQQTRDEFEIDLWGPLGQGRIQIVKKNARITLRNGQDRVLAEGDGETIMRDQLGWSLPIEILPAWVQGRPLAGVAARSLTYDERGRLATFEQLGWSVILSRYETLIDERGSRDLPTRITASNERSRIRLVVSEWQI